LSDEGHDDNIRPYPTPSDIDSMPRLSTPIDPHGEMPTLSPSTDYDNVKPYPTPSDIDTMPTLTTPDDNHDEKPTKSPSVV